MSYKININLFIFFFMAATSNIFAASFSCIKASDRIEKLICADKQLSVLDDQLAKTYRVALESADTASRPSLIKEQRNWMKYTRASCADTDCLNHVYSLRISELARNDKYIGNPLVQQINIDGEMRNIVFQRDPNSRIESFNKSLAVREDGKIVVCQRLVDIPVGFSNANHSFGGYCTIEDRVKRKEIEICNDNLVGHFAIEDISKNLKSDDQLIKFTNANCFGG